MNRVDSKSLQLVSRRPSPMPDTNAKSSQAESHTHNQLNRKQARLVEHAASQMAHTERCFFQQFVEVPACVRVGEKVFDTSVYSYS